MSKIQSIKLKETSNDFIVLKNEWLIKARKMTLEELPAFLKDLTEQYEHDYGTICHAVAIAAIATAWAVDRSPQGGITGFQAGCIMWEFIREWNFSSNKTGLKIVDYDNFLYPQYSDLFDKTIPESVWEVIKKEAQANILKADREYVKYLNEVEQYKKDIAEFVIKYPDYYERKKFYDPLGYGTGIEWEEEKKKKESGFEFAPQCPLEPINKNSAVYKHWLAITSGRIPFGYKTE